MSHDYDRRTAKDPKTLQEMERLEDDFVQAVRHLTRLKDSLAFFVRHHPNLKSASPILREIIEAYTKTEKALKAFGEAYRDEHDIARHEEEAWGAHDAPEHFSS